MKQRIKIISAAGLLGILFGCQLSRLATPTPDFKQDQGRFFLHQIRAPESNKYEDVHIVIDKKEIKDLRELDQSGIGLSEGEHHIEIHRNDKSSGLTQLDYRVNKSEHLHLFYCESDGSYHWVTNKNSSESNGNVFDRARDFCK